MQLVSKAKCEQILISSDFSLSHIDWSTGTAISNDAIHNHFPNAVKDNVLWRLVHFPTRINNKLWIANLALHLTWEEAERSDNPIVLEKQLDFMYST